MSVDYSDAIIDALEESGLSYQLHEFEDNVVFSFLVGSSHLPSLNVKLRVSDDGIAKIWCCISRNVNQDKRIQILEILNNFNSQYRYVRFALDEDNDIYASYYFNMFGEKEEAVKHALAMLLLISKLADMCVPEILKAIWSGEK